MSCSYDDVSQIAAKKHEKLEKELMRKLDELNERKKKLEETVNAKDADIKALEKVRAQQRHLLTYYGCGFVFKYFVS